MPSRAGIPNRRFATANRAKIVAQLEKIAFTWCMSADPKEQQEGFKAIAPYFIPRLTTTTLQGDGKHPIGIVELPKRGV